MKVITLAGVAASTIFSHVPLGTALRNAGHQVMMTASMDQMVDVLTQTGLPVVPITDPNYTPQKVLADFGLTRVPEDPVEREQMSGQWYARLEAVTLDALLRFTKDWRPDVVVGGQFSWAAPLLAAHLGVPWVRHGWDIHDRSHLDLGASRELVDDLAAVGLDGLPEPDMSIEITPPSMLPADSPPAQMMRWIPGNTQCRLEPWMYRKSDSSRIGVTIGTGVGKHNQHDFLHAIVEQVANLGEEVVVAVPDDDAEQLLDRVDDNVRAGWIPLDVVAPTLDVLVHQAGGSTMMTAMSMGVPQVLVPDPKLHRSTDMARRLAETGAGVVVPPEQATTEVIAKTCQEVIANPSYAQAADRLAKEIASLPLPVEVARRVEWLVDEKP